MKDEETDTAKINSPFLGSSSLTSTVGEPATDLSSVNCEPATAHKDTCNNTRAKPDENMATNKISMENLVPEPGFRKAQRSVKIWQLVSLVACIVAVVMLALFIWQLTSAKGSESSGEGKSMDLTDSYPALERCPQLPPLLLPLPDTLPEELRKTLDKIDKYLKGLVNVESHLPAISANIYYKDRIIWRGHYGRKKPDDPEPPNDSTHYRIGSITKVFAVMMVYKMYEQGLIDSLDDPLNKYAPDFHINNPFTGENITLRQIANQLSGLPREAPCVACMNNETTASQLKALRNRSLVMEPGTFPSYSNLGYALLGRLLTERAQVNMTFEEWLMKNVLTPWGLGNTGFHITKEIQQNMAFPCDKAGKVLPFMNIGWISPSGQMYSNANDMAKLGMYLNEVYRNHSVLKLSHIREMLAPSSIASDGQILWGSPWEMIFHKHFLVRSKGGAVDTYSAMMGIVPEMELGFTLLINTVANLTNGALIANPVLDYTMRNVLPVLNETLFQLNKNAKFPVDSEFYIGTYNVTEVDELTWEESHYQATISSSQSRLLFRKTSGKKIYLYYIGKKLILQGKRVLSTCFIERMGNFGDFYFSESNSDGVSPSFQVPGWGMRGTRA